MTHTEIITTITGDTYRGWDNTFTPEEFAAYVQEHSTALSAALDLPDGILAFKTHTGGYVLIPAKHVVSHEFIDLTKATLDETWTFEETGKDRFGNIHYRAVETRTSDQDGGLWPWARHFSDAAASIALTLDKDRLGKLLNAIADDLPQLAEIDPNEDVSIELELLEDGEIEVTYHDHRDGQPCQLHQDRRKLRDLQEATRLDPDFARRAWEDLTPEGRQQVINAGYANPDGTPTQLALDIVESLVEELFGK